MYLFKLYDIPITLLLRNNLTKFVVKQIKFDSFYGRFLRTMWRGSRKLEIWVQSDVLSIVDQDHQWWAIVVVNHSSKCEDTYSMVNSLLTGRDIENVATLQELPEKSTTSVKRKKKVLLEIERKESKKPRNFQKQSLQAEPEQCK